MLENNWPVSVNGCCVDFDFFAWWVNLIATPQQQQQQQQFNIFYYYNNSCYSLGVRALI
jgi:hypothetical protein